MTRRLDDATRRRLVVSRQLLHHDGRSARGVVDVPRAVGPLHSTDPSTAYLQLAVRADVDVATIERALYEDRELLRHSTLRRTVHLLTPEDAHDAHGCFNHRLVRTLGRNLTSWLAASDEVAGDAASWLVAVCDEVLAAIAALDRPSGNDLAAAVPALTTTVDPAAGKAHGKPIRITSKVLELLIAQGRVARDRPRGKDWTSGAWTYGVVSAWLDEPLTSDDPTASLAGLLGRRLVAMPGCSVVDLAWWTGLPKGQVTRALTALDAVEVVRDDSETGFVAVGDDLDDPPSEPAAMLLPGLDATPMGCKQRDWFLGGHDEVLFDRNGNIGPTVWWDGRVVGGWTQRADGEVVTRLLDDVGADAESAVGVEAARTQSFLGDVRVNWRYPTPLQRELETA